MCIGVVCAHVGRAALGVCSPCWPRGPGPAASSSHWPALPRESGPALEDTWLTRAQVWGAGGCWNSNWNSNSISSPNPQRTTRAGRYARSQSSTWAPGGHWCCLWGRRLVGRGLPRMEEDPSGRDRAQRGPGGWERGMQTPSEEAAFCWSPWWWVSSLFCYCYYTVIVVIAT